MLRATKEKSMRQLNNISAAEWTTCIQIGTNRNNECSRSGLNHREAIVIHGGGSDIRNEAPEKR